MSIRNALGKRREGKGPADAPGAGVGCPRCGAALEQQAVPPRGDVAYVRTRLLLLCSGCGRTLVVEQDRTRGVRP